MQIRKLTAADEPFLWQVFYYAISVPPGEAAPPREIVNLPELSCYVSGWMQEPGDLGLLAEDQGVPVGAAWLRCWTGQQRGYGFVDEATPELSMALLPGHRGHGTGTMLLRRLLSEAAAHFSSVSLSVSHFNPARRLYEREGFRPVGRSDDGSITMVKVLRRSSP